MNVGTEGLHLEEHAPIPTWMRVGGGADRLARPNSVDELVQCLEIDPELRVLGDGANLLVDDAGVSELVVSLRQGAFREVEWVEREGWVRAGAGAPLPQLINEAVRRGLGGLEKLAGIPASVGGATVMNAGGAFGDMAGVVTRVHAMDRAGREHVYDRGRIDFGYRQSRLNHLVVTAVEFRLEPGDKDELRDELKRCMAYKRDTQPLKDDSAGCVFKNPTLESDVEGIGAAGDRVSAGMLLDRAGCKGLAYGGARVSDVHANFFTAEPGARARDVVGLINETRKRVLNAFGVRLQREIVFWERTG